MIVTRELCSCTSFSQAEILVMVGGAILPAPAVPVSTIIFARMKRLQEHISPVYIVVRPLPLPFVTHPVLSTPFFEMFTLDITLRIPVN